MNSHNKTFIGNCNVMVHTVQVTKKYTLCPSKFPNVQTYKDIIWSCTRILFGNVLICPHLYPYRRERCSLLFSFVWERAGIKGVSFSTVCGFAPFILVNYQTYQYNICICTRILFGNILICPNLSWYN